ncbi:MAG: hypothetical protein IJV71_08250 [Lachnospiraceae bacterium]|nr:hypothetical protein [Lachnospiraceae bacterium]
MNFITKLERKFGRFAINNLIIYVLGAYAVGYILSIAFPQVYSMLLLDPRMIFTKGQVWRIFTWICTIPQELNLFVVFMFLFYYWIGQTLERYWGTFRYNLYMFSGWFFMTVGAIVIYFVSGGKISLSMDTYYINMTSFLAFATLFPDTQVMLMMLIPIKMKWLAIADLVLIGYSFITYLGLIIQYHTGNILLTSNDYMFCMVICVSIVISLLNFLIFYFATRNYKRYSPKEVKRKKEYKKQVKMAAGVTRHKCAICGRTENDGEGLVFRFCSKCEGNYEYCQDHLFTHEHVGVRNQDE